MVLWVHGIQQLTIKWMTRAYATNNEVGHFHILPMYWDGGGNIHQIIHLI